ncbi:MAG: isocitrate lyase/phosphoenolpyruvate mutase family protein [Proteobacteria bacterium]|nr:isocitrate lyase/phosphoenolpyruvate mutase family protein [Pseudomonadota bacterium]HQR03040.1 isocitrate lyase/phosphoenolpyruvate mutase family protein [Rhodocyclaceae bacterium]
MNQHEKALAFQSLHWQEDAFILPNPWDAGSARLLTMGGFAALATTSAGFAFSRGHADNTLSREVVIAHVRDVVAATPLPVSADLEDGFGDAPEIMAETIGMAAKAGAVGGSIEDATRWPEQPLYPLSLAVERIQAAVEAARLLPFPFTITARAENYTTGNGDIDDTIRRLQAYETAGAEVLFAPGITRREDIALLVSSVKAPINVMAGSSVLRLSIAELGELGVKRISLGGSLARAALSALMLAAREVRDQGSFSYAEAAMSAGEINRLFSQPVDQIPDHTTKAKTP